MQKLLTTFINALQLPVHPTPLLIQSEFYYAGPDESSIHTLILQENEHFINAYNESQQDDSDSNDGYDAMTEIFNKFKSDFPNLLFTHEDSPIYPHTKTTTFSQLPSPTSFLTQYINKYGDSLTMQFSDHNYYITFIQSGQY